MKMVFNIEEVARICKVAPRTVHKWFDSGRLRGYRIPGTQDRRIPREYLIRFMKEHGLSLGELEAEETQVEEPIKHPDVPVKVEVHPSTILSRLVDGVWTCVRVRDLNVNGCGVTIEQAYNHLISKEKANDVSTPTGK